MKGSRPRGCYAGRTSLIMRTKLQLTLGALAALALPLAGFADSDSAAVAISTRASPDYSRPQLPNGSYQPESFAFGKGGVWSGAAKDPTIDKLDFIDIARTIAVPLASQNFVSSHDPNNTRLLIMVYWGTTHAPEHQHRFRPSEPEPAVCQPGGDGCGEPRPDRAVPSERQHAPRPAVAQSAANGYAIRSPEQIDLDNAMPTGAMAAVAARGPGPAGQRTAKNAVSSGLRRRVGSGRNAYKGTPLEFSRRKEPARE